MIGDFTFHSFIGWFPSLVTGLVVLLIGFIIAKILEGFVSKTLRKFKVNEKLGVADEKWSIEKIISKVVFYGILLLALIIFFNIMNMSMIATPFIGIYSGFAGAILGVLKAAVILFIAWVIALLAKKLVMMIGNKINIGKYAEKIGYSRAEVEEGKWVDNAANIVFYLILLLFMPAILHALGLSGVSGPFEGLLQSFLNFIPKLVGAAIIFAVGYFIAKIIRTILTKLLETVGVNRFAEKLKLSQLIKGTSISSVIGTIVFVLIMIPVTISALEALDLRGISEPAIAMLNDIVTMLPNIVVAILLILVGVWIAKWVKGIVVSLLDNLGVNSLFSKMGVRSTNTSTFTIAEVIGTIVQVILIFLFVVEALNVVNLNFMVTLATGIFAYLPMVISAIIILAIGYWLATLAERFIGSVMTTASGTPHVLRYIAKYAILAFALFMALDQLGIARSIINAAFILTLGGVALAVGLAFGLGGREHASRYLSKMEHSLQSTEVSKTKWEAEKAKAKHEAKEMGEQVEDAVEGTREGTTDWSTFEDSDFNQSTNNDQDDNPYPSQD